MNKADLSLNKSCLPQRYSMRLHEYDYSHEGLYFVTICTQDRIYYFGDITGGEMMLNDIGDIVKKCWLAMPEHFPHITLHEFVIMPNHIHGIIEIGTDVGANKHSPDDTILFKSPSRTIVSVIRGFKIGVMKCYKEYIKRANVYSPLQKSSIWQRNYYEHNIRNDESYNKIAEYIYENPECWQTDDYYN